MSAPGITFNKTTLARRTEKILARTEGCLTSQQLLDAVNIERKRMTYRMLVNWRNSGWIVAHQKSVIRSGGLLLWGIEDVEAINSMLDMFERAARLMVPIKDGSMWDYLHEPKDEST